MGDLVKIFLILDAGENPALQPIVQAQRAGEHSLVSSPLTDLFRVKFKLPVQALPDLGPLQDDEDEPEPKSAPSSSRSTGYHASSFGTRERLEAQVDELKGIKISVDLPLASAQSWCPSQATSPLFGMLDNALGLICFAVCRAAVKRTAAAYA